MIYSDIKNILLVLISFAVLQSCNVRTLNSPDISVSHSDIYAWLNLMPGGPSSFHITGNLIITHNEWESNDDIVLKNIIITQEEEPLYRFEPVFEPVPEQEVDLKTRKENDKHFRFMVKSGLKISPDLNSEKTIDAKLIFNFGDTIFEYSITDIFVEKTY